MVATRLSLHELGNLLGELHSGRNPSWTEQASLTKAPITASDGVSLKDADDGGALATYFQIRVRRVASYRTAVYQITEANTDTYTIGFDGPLAAFPVGVVSVNYVSDASATKQEIADGLKAAIEADGTLNAALSAYSELDPDTSDYRLRVTGKPGSALGSDDFLIEAAGAAGAGDLTVSADPTYCRVVFWGFPGGVHASTSGLQDLVAYQAYVAPPDGETETSPWMNIMQTPEPTGLPKGVQEGRLYVHFGGYMDRLATAGLARLAIQTEDITGPTETYAVDAYYAPRTIIGPARRESAQPVGT